MRKLLVPRTHSKLAIGVLGRRSSTEERLSSLTIVARTVLELLQTVSEISSIWLLEHLVTLLNL